MNGWAAIAVFAAAALSGAAFGATCEPIEKREPNVPDQRPAFPGQARACAIKSNVAFDVVVLDLQMPGVDGLSCLAAIRRVTAWSCS